MKVRKTVIPAAGVADGSAVTEMPYVPLDIIEGDAVEKVITDVNPDVIVHCATWTAVDMAEDDDKVAAVRNVMLVVRKILLMLLKSLMYQWFTFQLTMFLTVKEPSHGNQTSRVTSL